MIINVRGTSGSGKTTLMRHFMSLCSSTENIYPEGSKKAEALKCIYKGQIVFLLGSYANTCGGCDTINKQDTVCQLIEDYSFEGHVMFEGLMISHIYERYAAKARVDVNNWWFLMLETKFETCMEHIRQRRREQGKDDTLKESVFTNARRTFDATYRIRDKFTAEGINWKEVPLTNRFGLFEMYIDDILGLEEL